MKKFTKVIVCTTGALVLAGSLAAEASGQLRRYAADYWSFGGGEYFTTNTSLAGPDEATPAAAPNDGALFYRKTITVNSSINTLYVEVDTTGDAHDGAALRLSCRINGKFCKTSNNPSGVDGAPSGWITLLKVPTDVQDPTGTNNCQDGGGGSADCHDNNINYTWCIPLEPYLAPDGSNTPVTIDLKMSSSSTDGVSDGVVFIEKGHVFIDGSKFTPASAGSRCGQAPPIVAAPGEDVAFGVPVAP
ncbi:MAG: hypothetical protein EPO03_12895 [Porticoccaceae bacterium]|nr:MAG: hypothetical protein EPO03_12895 [Porticoccaceae bacterium]